MAGGARLLDRADRPPVSPIRHLVVRCVLQVFETLKKMAVSLPDVLLSIQDLGEIFVRLSGSAADAMDCFSATDAVTFLQV